MFAPSPEDELIAMETVMSEMITFKTITEAHESPLPVSQTAFKVLVEGNVEACLDDFGDYLNENGKLTVEEAKRFVADNPPKEPIPSIAEVLELAMEQYPGFDPTSHIDRTQSAANYLVSRILGAAYWVATMTRDNSAGRSSLPPTYEEAKDAIGTSTNYTTFFYNREKEDRDESRIGLSGGQWSVLEGRGDALVAMLTELDGYIADGFDPDVDREEAFAVIVEQQSKNATTKGLAAEATRARQQAEAKSASANVATGRGF
jgi:hypothetical protein